MDPQSMAALSAAGINPGNSVGTTQQAPQTDYDRSLTYVNDSLNWSIANGANPLSHKDGRFLTLLGPGLFGQRQAQDFIDSIITFNQRDDVKQMAPEQRLETYFNMKSNNDNVEGIKTKLKKFGYGATQRYWDSPNLDVQQQQVSQPQVTASK